MEPFALIVLGAVLYVQAWNLLRLTDIKIVGMISAAAALALGALVVFQTLPLATVGSRDVDHGTAVGAMIALWAIYAAALAGVALWDMKERALGFLGLFLAVTSLAFMVYFWDALGTLDGVISNMMAAANLALAVLWGLLFFLQVPPFRRIQNITGYFFLVGGILVAVIGLAHLLDVIAITE